MTDKIDEAWEAIKQLRQERDDLRESLTEQKYLEATYQRFIAKHIGDDPEKVMSDEDQTQLHVYRKNRHEALKKAGEA